MDDWLKQWISAVSTMYVIENWFARAQSALGTLAHDNHTPMTVYTHYIFSSHFSWPLCRSRVHFVHFWINMSICCNYLLALSYGFYSCLIDTMCNCACFIMYHKAIHKYWNWNWSRNRDKFRYSVQILLEHRYIQWLTSLYTPIAHTQLRHCTFSDYIFGTVLHMFQRDTFFSYISVQ